MELIVVVLSVAVLILATKLFSLLHRIESISKQLDDKENDLITTQLNNDVLEDVVKKINLMKEKNHDSKIIIRKEQTILKQAITDISHDIRTPLTSVIGYLQLAEKSAESKEMQNNLEIALERAKYCNNLMNDFFELSLIDSKGIEPVMEIVDVNDLICELILANYPNFKTNDITPHFKDNNKPIYACADRKMLTRVIQNLISNSIKYGVDTIFFSLNTNDSIQISVSNNILDKNIDTEKIFDKFYRENKSRSTNGAGIGLYICKQLVESMNGKISAYIENDYLTITVKLLSE